MKVAHITSVHPQNDNRILYKECTTLANNGYDISLVVAGADSKVVDGVKIIGYEKANTGRVKRMVQTSFFKMLKICKEVNANVYHFHDPELMFVGLYLKVKGKIVIYDIHENNPASILSKPYIKSKLIRKILAKSFDIFEKIAVRFFDAIVTARPDISERFNHENLITLKNFPILPNLSEMQTVEITKTKPSIIFVGGITKIRGINELLDAFESLNKYELWLLGPISETILQSRIEKGCKNVKYFGTVEAYEVFNYINKADIGIITFLPLPNHLNTLATKPFEYMACGKPIIMSNFEYWKDTFKESSLYVDPVNPNDIAEKIENLLGNKALMKNMGNLNRRLSIDEYNWEKESQKLLNLYQKLLLKAENN
jgi:glycosyltransferase involved in cell wall biosynthesis